LGGSGKPNNPKAAEGEESSIMKSREGVRWAMRLGTVWSVRNGCVSKKRPIEGRKDGWWEKVSLKRANNAVGAIASSR
jgi:hypothetical protein